MNIINNSGKDARIMFNPRKSWNNITRRRFFEFRHIQDILLLFTISQKFSARKLNCTKMTLISRFCSLLDAKNLPTKMFTASNPYFQPKLGLVLYFLNFWNTLPKGLTGVKLHANQRKSYCFSLFNWRNDVSVVIV